MEAIIVSLVGAIVALVSLNVWVTKKALNALIKGLNDSTQASNRGADATEGMREDLKNHEAVAKERAEKILKELRKKAG